MENIIDNVINILYDDLQSLNYYIINVLSYILFFRKISETKTQEKTNELNTYIQEFYSKYNFKMKKLNNDELDCIGEMFNNLDNYDHDYLQLFINTFNLKKELKHYAKELRSYYTYNEIVDYIINIIGPINQYKRILNLFSGTGSFIKKIIKNNKNSTNMQLLGYDINDELNIIAKLLIILETETDYSENISTCNLIKDEILIDKADLIIADLPSDIKNLTHASCNNQIKKLKIRGTKSEPLMIQMISTLLKKNGKAILKIPDSFLFGDSNQHIETRKYLINNFFVEQIIAIPNYKKSILIFSNKKSNNHIKFTDIENTYELKLDINMMSEKSFSLYYQNYHIILNKDRNISTKKGLYKIKDIINIVNTDTEISKINKDETVLISCKNNIFKITKLSQLIQFSQYDQNNKYIVYTTKNKDSYPQNFLNYHLFEFLSNNIKYLTKGKCKTIDIDMILNLDINIPDIKIQKNCLEFINLNGSSLVLLQQQIMELEKMKNNLIESTIMEKNTKPLLDFCEISHNSTHINTIQINRNSNMAGKVSLTTNNTDSSTNIFYLNSINDKINSNVLYYILKYYEKDLIDLSNSGNTIQLPKNKLENIPIHELTKNEENEIIKCVTIDEKIKKLKQIYQDLLLESNITFL